MELLSTDMVGFPMWLIIFDVDVDVKRLIFLNVKLGGSGWGTDLNLDPMTPQHSSLKTYCIVFSSYRDGRDDNEVDWRGWQ